MMTLKLIWLTSIIAIMAAACSSNQLEPRVITDVATVYRPIPTEFFDCPMVEPVDDALIDLAEFENEYNERLVKELYVAYRLCHGTVRRIKDWNDVSIELGELPPNE